ncbi:MAG TPA: glycosyltransferase family 4 protein [Denitromonas sp.]|uniref:glycosyltransferase family 4 protein n=1 Tax=Denitromonas sp. TaxID=2734609 RepID=UPI002C9327A9|nr:glycosyltransferase family 4 protein [Zoogloeaceae bacterium]HQU87689.1 glycosyltransferase family 4 protein [Denitromonas sp.]HQV14449.1 glycosyltransferase family 4 protein [Denitromonas sp.]
MSFKTLNLVVVGPLPPPAGGMANQTRQLAELLRSEGARVAVVQTNAAYRPRWAGRLPGVRAAFRLVPYLVGLWHACGQGQLVHLMANSGWSWHLFAVPAIIVARLRGVPVVVNYRGGEAGSFLNGSAGVVRRVMRHVAALVLPSGYLQAVFQGYGMAGEIVPNIIDLERFHPSESPAVGAAPHIVVARNLEQIYGIDVALQAFAQIRRSVPSATLSVAGSGPQLASLQAQAEALGIASAVRFTGRLDRDEMADLYRSADVMINASRVDNMPNSVLEALASGVAVVSTDVGGVPYIVEHEKTALLVPPDVPEPMAKAVVRLLEDDALRQRLVAAGLADVVRYQWASVSAQWLGVYRRALGGLPQTGSSTEGVHS